MSAPPPPPPQATGKKGRRATLSASLGPPPSGRHVTAGHGRRKPTYVVPAAGCQALSGPPEVEAGRAGKIGTRLEESAPGCARDAIGLPGDRGLVQREDAAVSHEPSTVDHDGLDVARLALVHETGDDPQGGREMRLPQIDQDQVCAVSGR